MKKFNQNIYEGIKKNKIYKDNYYIYILLNKNEIYKSWDSKWLEGKKYEFYGLLDKTKKDVFTLNNSEEIQKEFNNKAEEIAKKEILKNYDFYINLQKNNFDEKIKNDDFKKSILYYYIDTYSSNNFNELFIHDKTPEQFKKELLNNIVKINKNLNNETFLQKYINENSTAILEELKNNIFNGAYFDEWQFNYNWQNGTPEEKRVEANFKNDISFKLNKINLVIKEYEKIFNNPSEQLKKSKKLYKLCNEFLNNNNNKTCYIYLKNNDYKFKILDFKYLITIFEGGKAEGITYRLLTGNEQIKIKDYNEFTKNKKYESDLYIEDIQKIEFNNKIIYEEK